VLVAVGLAVGAVFAAPALADSIDDRRAAAEQRQKELEQQKADTQAAMEGVDADIQELVAQLQDTQAKIPAAQQALDAANDAVDKARREQAMIAAQLQDAQDQQSTLAEQIDADSAHAEELRAAIGQMAREAYRDGGGVSTVDVILGAQSTEDFVQRYGMMTTALRTQAQVLDGLREAEATNRNSHARLTAVTERIGELKEAADAKLAEADAAAKEAAAAKKALDDLLAQQTSQQASLEDKKADLQAQLQAADAEAAKVQRELEQAIAEQRERDAAANKPPPPPGPLSGALFGNPTSVNPIHVTSEYGWRLHPILGYYRLHAGIDLRTYCNTPIYAGRAGTVLWARWRNGFGNQVMVDHGFVNGNGLSTSYNHMTSFVVSAGQHVEQGQLLGYSGNTGTSAACHLHFEVYVNGQTVNPRPLLGL